MLGKLLSGSVLVCVAFCSQGCTRQQSPPSPPQIRQVSDSAVKPSGEQLFRQYCSSCHPGGGNVNDPQRSLYSSSLKSRRITTSRDIVHVMRNPRSRMIRFDSSMISDPDAYAIAEYILTTF